MTKITYIEFNGTEHPVDVMPGLSVMQGALANNVRGIIGDCGGSCSCATCHVYVDPAWVNRVGEKNEGEAALLEEVVDSKPNSRLSCQITVTEDMDGLVVRMPARQV